MEQTNVVEVTPHSDPNYNSTAKNHSQPPQPVSTCCQPLQSTSVASQPADFFSGSGLSEGVQEVPVSADGAQEDLSLVPFSRGCSGWTRSWLLSQLGMSR